MNAIILAAGMGRRLNHGAPKCLTRLNETMTILDLQLAHLSEFTRDIRIVVGFQKNIVMTRHPGHAYTSNDDYATTNTAASLALALDQTPPGDVLWVNGDVVFSAEAIERVLSKPGSGMAAKRGRMGEEEVKYRTDSLGRIIAVSKKVPAAEGEAVGINFVVDADRNRLRKGLAQCGPGDYFERGIELALADGLDIFERDISDLPCLEVDFPADLEAAKLILTACLPAVAAKS